MECFLNQTHLMFILDGPVWFVGVHLLSCFHKKCFSVWIKGIKALLSAVNVP